jgi:hypothetical protein
VRLRHPRERLIDRLGLSGSARHARDQERRAQRSTEDRARCVDLRQIDLGQRTIDQPVLIKAASDAFARDVAFQIDADVVGFA